MNVSFMKQFSTTVLLEWFEEVILYTSPTKFSNSTCKLHTSVLLWKWLFDYDPECKDEVDAW